MRGSRAAGGAVSFGPNSILVLQLGAGAAEYVSTAVNPNPLVRACSKTRLIHLPAYHS